MTKVGISVSVTSVVTFTSGNPNGGSSGDFLLQEDGFTILQEDDFSVLVEIEEDLTIMIELLGTASINLQTLTAQNVYTVPTGKKLMITQLVCRDFTATLDKSFSLGFNDPTNTDVCNFLFDADVIPDTVTQCLIPSLSSFIPVATTSITATNDKTDAARAQNHEIGLAGETLRLLMASANTLAATMNIDVLGYLVDA